MDASLLKAREAFKARAIATPVIEKSAKKKDSTNGSGKSSPSVSRKSTPTPSSAPAFDYKTSTGASQFKFRSVVASQIARQIRGEFLLL